MIFGLTIGFLLRRNMERAAMGLVTVILTYSVIEMGVMIVKGYGIGLSKNFVEPHQATFMNRINLILTEMGAILITILMLTILNK